MKKYIEAGKLTFKAQLAYRFDVAMNVLFTVSKILFAYILWGAIFGSRQTVAGFTFPMMLTYYLFSSFLSQIDLSDGVSSEMGERIKGGTFSKYMVIPANTQLYFIAQTIGKLLFYLIFNLLAAFAWALLFRMEPVFTTNPRLLLAALFMVLLGLLFMIQLNFFLGLLAFKYQDIGFFLMIKNNFTAFLTGTLVPLALLPQGVVAGMRFFPFYYVTYLPSMLLLGKNQNEALPGLLILSAWLLFFTVLCGVAYRRLRTIYDGVGI